MDRADSAEWSTVREEGRKLFPQSREAKGGVFAHGTRGPARSPAGELQGPGELHAASWALRGSWRMLVAFFKQGTIAEFGRVGVPWAPGYRQDPEEEAWSCSGAQPLREWAEPPQVRRGLRKRGSRAGPERVN